MFIVKICSMINKKMDFSLNTENVFFHTFEFDFLMQTTYKIYMSNELSRNRYSKKYTLRLIKCENSSNDPFLLLNKTGKQKLNHIILFFKLSNKIFFNSSINQSIR